ncbi:MAG: substrate-binding domain-containing protein [Bacteroidota bacterium]
MKTLLKTIYIAFVVIVIASCQSQNESVTTPETELSGSISISGAFALYPMTVKWAEEFQKLHPDVRIDISAGGAGKGMTDVLSGIVDLAMFSREVSPEEENNGAWKIAVTKDAVIPTNNYKNQVIQILRKKGMTKSEFRDIFIEGKVSKWPDGSKMNVYTRSDACGAAEMWGKYLDGNQENLTGIGVFGDPGMADAIRNDIFGIGFNNVIYAYDITSRKTYEGIDVIPLDINGNGVIDDDENFYSSLDKIMIAIKDGRYPSPPARELYFISKGKPTDRAVIEFIRWILTDGQKFIDESGYVQLPIKKISIELSRIN